MEILFLLFWGQFSAAEILFPANDPYAVEKQMALDDLKQLMPGFSAIQNVLKSNKVILWANSVAMAEKEIDVPSFTPMTENNKNSLRIEMEQKCQCSLIGKDLAGVLVANPYQAAEMYFRSGWLNHKDNEVDGLAPPIVIIYHEIGHASDYITNSDYFFDLATFASNQWKNQAEHSAVIHQNELANALAQQKGITVSLRRSYGKNRLYFVKDLYSTEEIKTIFSESSKPEL